MKKEHTKLVLIVLLLFFFLDTIHQTYATSMDSNVGFTYTESKDPITQSAWKSGGKSVSTKVTANDRLPQTGEKQSINVSQLGFLTMLLGFLLVRYTNYPKERLQKYLLAASSVFLISITLVPLTGYALNTQGEIGFTENQGPVDPVDPKDPTKPIKPIKPPTDGPLSLDFVSDFQFGSHRITNKDSAYFAELMEITRSEDNSHQLVPNFVELTDNRGTLSGWKLYVKQNRPLQNEGGFALKGTKFIFSNVTATPLSSQKDELTRLSLKSVEVNGDFSEDVLVFQASPKHGYGSWSIDFGATEDSGKSSVALQIPGGTKKETGKYTTTLTWSLVDGI